MAAGGAVNIAIDPVNALWRIETQEQIDLAGLTASGLGGTHFLINSAKNATEYYVWFDENATDVDPAPGGKTEIKVAYAASAALSVIVTAMTAAIGGLSDFVTSETGTVVTVRRDVVGNTTATVDVDSSAAITICRNGQDLDLGLISGNIELTFSPANFIVQAHQTGVTPRAALFQGIETAEVGLELLETQDSKLKVLYGVYGSSGFTPSAGTEVFGVGTSKQGANLLIDAARLELKPVNAADDLTNKTLMLALPVPDTLVFSGEDPRTLSVTFQGFVDDTIDTRVDTLLFGDPTQTNL